MVFATPLSLANELGDYMDNFYNPKRLHATIGYVSAIEAEVAFNLAPQAAQSPCPLNGEQLKRSRSPSPGRRPLPLVAERLMYVAGATFFGRVMVVPGLLRVETRFLHASMVPLVPTSSWVMLDSPEENKLFDPSFKGHRLPSLSWRSVVFAYLRFLMVMGMIFGALFVYVVYAINGLHVYVLIPLLVAVGSYFAYRKSQTLALATLEDLAQLSAAGVPQEILDRARAQLDLNSPARVL